MKKTMSGFTVVELLIVVVVIAIIATISAVAYSGMQGKARESKALAAAKQATTDIQVYKARNGAYPISLAVAGVQAPPNITFEYNRTDNWFCLLASTTGDSVKAGVGSAGRCGGLKADYFNNTALSGSPSLTRSDSNIDFDWGLNSPGSGVNQDNFSARWTGFITAPTTDNYTIHLFYDDNFRLYLNNTLVADRWGTGCCAWNTISYSFTAGKTVPIRVEMAEFGGGAGARVHWSYTGQTQIAVPSPALSQQ